MKILFTLILLLFCNLVEAKQYIPKLTDENAILSILGEGEGESFEGKLALARTIINRGNLKGVYGIYSKRVIQKKYSKHSYNQCKLAWEYAKNNPDKNWIALGWGNRNDLKKFIKTKWWKNCYVVADIGSHYFYTCKK